MNFKGLATKQETGHKANNLVEALFGRPAAELSEQRLLTVRRELGLLSRLSQLPSPIAAEVAIRYEETTRLSSPHNLSIQFVGLRPVFEGVKFYPGKNFDWALMNITEDPLFQTQGGKLYVPDHVLEDFANMREAGLDFPVTFIAHEIQKGAIQKGIPLEKLITPLPAEQVIQRLQKLDRVTAGFWKLVELAIKGIGFVSAAALAGASAAALGATAAALGATAAVGTAAAGLLVLDPILFGVNIIDSWTVAGYPMGMWWSLSYWSLPVPIQEV